MIISEFELINNRTDDVNEVKLTLKTRLNPSDDVLLRLFNAESRSVCLRL